MILNVLIDAVLHYFFDAVIRTFTYLFGVSLSKPEYTRNRKRCIFIIFLFIYA